jgi:hypothetical protein
VPFPLAEQVARAAAVRAIATHVLDTTKVAKKNWVARSLTWVPEKVKKCVDLGPIYRDEFATPQENRARQRQILAAAGCSNFADRDRFVEGELLQDTMGFDRPKGWGALEMDILLWHLRLDLVPEVDVGTLASRFVAGQWSGVSSYSFLKNSGRDIRKESDDSLQPVAAKTDWSKLFEDESDVEEHLRNARFDELAE